MGNRCKIGLVLLTPSSSLSSSYYGGRIVSFHHPFLSISATYVDRLVSVCPAARFSLDMWREMRVKTRLILVQYITRGACEGERRCQQTSIHRTNWTLKTPPSSPGLDDGSETFVTLDNHEFIKGTEAREKRREHGLLLFTLHGALSWCCSSSNSHILQHIRETARVPCSFCSGGRIKYKVWKILQTWMNAAFSHYVAKSENL